MYQPNHLTTKFRLIALLIAFSLFFYAFSLRHEVKAQAPNSPPALGFIGEFYPSNEIRIESQDYIDKYFDWQFTEINSTHWQANFSFKDFFYLDAKPLIYQVLPIEEDAIAFCEKYFSDYLNCSIDYYKPWRDLRNMSKYPLINLTYGITFSNYTYDNKTGKASFYIVFPEGFKEGEMAKLGFHSTVISTGRTTPFYPTRRNICKDGAGILHVVWLYNSTTIRYANSSDGVTWRVNETFYWTLTDTTKSNSTSIKYYPHISCDGNNITVVFEDDTFDDIVLALSTNNGATWTWSAPVTSGVTGQFGLSVERRGQRIYIVYMDASTDTIIKFINSTDGGKTWGPITAIMTPAAGDDMELSSMAVDGIGGSNDKIYVIARNSVDKDLWFVNSTNSGATWGTKINIYTGTAYYSSITFNSSNLYVAIGDSALYDIYFTNSTNSGITWTTAYRIDLLGASTTQAWFPSVTVDNSGNPWVFWEQNDTATRFNIVYRSHNGTAWNDTVINLTDNSFGNRYINTPYKYYNDNKIHYIWRNGTASPYQIMYDYIPVCNPPVSGDWTIASGADCVCNATWSTTGNLHVYGTLTMQSACNIIFTSTGKNIYVYPGGTIYQYPGAGFNKP